MIPAIGVAFAVGLVWTLGAVFGWWASERVRKAELTAAAKLAEQSIHIVDKLNATGSRMRQSTEALIASRGAHEEAKKALEALTNVVDALDRNQAAILNALVRMGAVRRAPRGEAGDDDVPPPLDRDPGDNMR